MTIGDKVTFAEGPGQHICMEVVEIEGQLGKVSGPHGGWGDLWRLAASLRPWTD